MIPRNLTRDLVIPSVMLMTTAMSSSQMTNAQNNSIPTLSSMTLNIRIFYIYNTNVLDFNETNGIQKSNLTGGTYSLQTILMNQSDKVIVTLGSMYHNMEAPS